MIIRFNLNNEMVKRLCTAATLVRAVSLILSAFSVSAWAGGGQLLGTAGVNSIEGSAGGGLIPWATLGSYATGGEYGVTVAKSETNVDDFQLSVHGASVNIHDRVELSVARMDFRIDPTKTLIRQTVAGVKVRVFGDLIYDNLPLFSAGLQYKSLVDDDTAKALGADNTDGVDLYLSAAKAWIDGIVHRTSFANLNLRYSKANELGLLGYGGDDTDRSIHIEAAAGLFLTENIALGLEYRQKRNHLSAIDEDDWSDIFIAFFPNKSVSLTAAYVNLGKIAGSETQNGLHFAIQGSF